MMTRDRFVGLAMAFLAIAYVYLGSDLAFFVRGRPGEGFFPHISAGLLLAISLSLVIGPGTEGVDRPARAELASICRVLGIIALTVALMPYTGFLIAVLTMLVLAWLPGKHASAMWVRLLLVVVIGLATYYLFDIALKIPLPTASIFGQ